MRIAARTVQELVDQLGAHPSLKGKVGPAVPGGPTAPSASAVRKAAASDPKIKKLTNSVQRLEECRKEGRSLLKASIRKAKTNPQQVAKYSKKWAGIEREAQSSLDLTYDLIRDSKTIAAYFSVVKDVDDVHRFANPALLDKSQRALLRDLGVDLHELADAYRFSYLPMRAQMDAAIKSLNGSVPTEGRRHTKKLVFLYAPERMAEKGILSVGGNWIEIALAIGGALIELAKLEEEARQAAAALKAANMLNLILLLLVWVIWMDLQVRLATGKRRLDELQQQYDEELRLSQAEPVSTTGGNSPTEVAAEYGYMVANMSRSKLEVHLPNCSWLPLIRLDHRRLLDGPAEARALGLDNCAFCIGGSTR